MSNILMIQGTGSSVGKSFLVAALCRILCQDGISVAPFKSQNMALNSFITKDNKEMGRAQVMQAECAGIEPSVLMNPILLKPTSDNISQVILNGEVYQNMGAGEYYRKKPNFLDLAVSSFNKLQEQFQTIIIEGAGSPAEINLRDNDIVNMGFAEAVDAPVILVGDIDKGGVFASIYGTYLLLNPEERGRVKGFIINKFRGDKKLLEPGIKMIEELIPIPCLGVIPYDQIDLDDEDSITNNPKRDKKKLSISIIRFHHFSNASDFTPFSLYPDIEVNYINNQKDLIQNPPDIIILPGSKNPIDDLNWMNESGISKFIQEHVGKIPIFGICGGFQILGNVLNDPNRLESQKKGIKGLSLLDISTKIRPSKITQQVEGKTLTGNQVNGYEIHMGETDYGDSKPLLIKDDGKRDGAVSYNKKTAGTYLHGIFDNDNFRENFLDSLGYKSKLNSNYKLYKEQQYDKLAQLVRDNIDIDKIKDILEL